MSNFQRNNRKHTEIASSKEDLLGLLHRSIIDEEGNMVCLGGGEPFEQEVIDNWYKARKYVLDILEAEDRLDDEERFENSHPYLHVVLEGASALMLSVARQIALIAHYVNFDERNGNNRTIITLLYNRNRYPDIVQEVFKEEYLCNLRLLCKYSLRNAEDEIPYAVYNETSFIDIEVELVGFKGDDFNRGNETLMKELGQATLRISDSDLQDVCAENTIDTSMARRTNMVYNVGADIDNLPADDPNTAERYSRALLYFCYQQKPQDTQKKWEEMTAVSTFGQPVRQVNLRNKISNVFCADCFKSRIKRVIDTAELEIGQVVIDTEKVQELILTRELDVLKLIRKNLKRLAQCEHARWNVEKLILGFRPLSDEQRWHDESIFGEERKAFRKQLKKRGIHIDLCSYQDLRRINPADMKYDCFLMMAMPRILKETWMSL